MVRSLAKHSGFFKKKDKNTIPETDMQENVAQMMEGPMDQDPVQEDADIADTDMNDIGVQETAVDAGNAVDEADIADDDTETSEDWTIQTETVRLRKNMKKPAISLTATVWLRSIKQMKLK